MAGKNTSVFGIYRGRAEAEIAVDRLMAAGFRGEDISALLPDNVGNKDFAHEKNTKAPEGTTTGAVTGGAVGPLAVRSDCWQALALWRYPVSGL
jgi:hypothetical protein